MTRPPFIDNKAPLPEEIFQDRRSKKNSDNLPTGIERRSRQQFDAIPWWLKVNYTKSNEAPKPPGHQSEASMREAGGK